MDSDVVVLSDMTVEVHRFPEGPVIGFNGTTEWALDSVEQSEVWVPAEHQLRELLGDAFAGLAPTGGDGYRVTLRVEGATSGHEGPDAAAACARALLRLLRWRRR